MDTRVKPAYDAILALAMKLSRRRAENMSAAAWRYGTAGKESRGDLGPAEILDIVEAQRS